MRRMKFGLVLSFAVALPTLLSGCGKTVIWDEEVLLNTGELIWVQRQVRYSLKGDAGNPADISYRPDWIERLSFSYRNTEYEYEGDAGLLLLAISPDRKPVLVAPAADKGWDSRRGFPCVKPYYAQFNSPLSDSVWILQPTVDRWAFNLPANISPAPSSLSAVEQRLTMQEKRKSRYMSDPRMQYAQRIDPEYESDTCKRRN